MNHEQDSELEIPQLKPIPSDGLTEEELDFLTGSVRSVSRDNIKHGLIESVNPLPPRSSKHGKNKKEADTLTPLTPPSPREGVVLVGKRQNGIEEVTIAGANSHEVNSKEQSKIAQIKSFIIRLLLIVLGVPILIALLFWAKFAYVYHIPSFMTQSTEVQGAKAYICYKPWWFGPVAFSLQDKLTDTQPATIDTLNLNLQGYQEIIGNSALVIYRFKN
jgi:hypothetical protein